MYYFRNFLLGALFLSTAMWAASAATDNDVVLEPEFTSIWSDKMTHFYKKGDYAEIEDSYSGQLLYKNHPIRLEAFFYAKEWLLCFYDFQDPLLEQHRKPFFIIYCDSSDSKESRHFIDWAETDNLPLEEVVSLVLYFKSFCKIPNFVYADQDSTYGCPFDGIHCSQAALMLRRSLDICLTESSLYEKFGGQPTYFKKGYREAKQFLHNLNIEELIQDINNVFPKTVANQMNGHFASFQKGSGLIGDAATLGNISRKLQEKSSENKQAHLLWHEFHDRVIAFKQNNTTMFIHALMKNPTNLSKELMKGLGFLLFFETNWYFDALIDEAKREHSKSSPDWDFIKQVQDLAKQFPDNLSKAMQLYCQRKLVRLKNGTALPSYYSVVLKASETSILKHFAYYILIEASNNSKQIYIDTTNALVNQMNKEGIKQLDTEGYYLKALKEYKANPSACKPGTVFALWIYSKWLVNSAEGIEL